MADVEPNKYVHPTSIALDPDAVETLRTEAKARSWSRSEVVRRLLKALREGRVMI